MPDAAPLVSVIVPAYNVSEWISQALGSVHAQTMDDLEVIVVDDGSTDGPALDTALAPFRDRLTLIRQPNQGVAAARNAAARVAKGKWLAFLDGDDTWAPRFLEAQLDLAVRHSWGMIWSNGRVIGDLARAGQLMLPATVHPDPVTLRGLICQEFFVITSATVVSAEVFRAAGGFNESLRRAQDFELWARLLHAGIRAGYNPTPLVQYRIREASLSGDDLQQVDRALAVMRHLQTTLGHDPEVSTMLRDRHATLVGSRALLQAKDHLRERRYREARLAVGAAGGSMGRPKRRALQVGLLLAPGLTRWAYLRFFADGRA